MNDRPPALPDLSLPEMEALFRSWDQPAYRARQVYRQLYVNLADSFEAMSDLPVVLRQQLARETRWTELQLLRVLSGDKGQTRKALFQVEGGPPVEAVLMLYRDRATVCVSTQSGCAMNCSFCATGRMGFRLNLSAGQMIEQVLWAARELRAGKPEGRRLTNVVFMGMGEPFNNYDRWWACVERLHDPQGFNLGARSFTVSTVGVIPGIRRLAREALPVNLAVSLHAPDDALRNRLVPLNKKYPIAPLMAAVRDYISQTHRRVSFEYVLLQGVNDGSEQARGLATLLRDRDAPLLCHVNLIPWNPVPGAPLKSSDKNKALEFQRILETSNIPCTLRTQRGVDIAAACGQLAGGVV